MSRLTNDATAYMLSEQEHEKIFQKKIIPAIFHNVRTLSKPVAIIFGGQPGAGKSSALDAALDELASFGNAALIIGDELRDYHPHYERLLSVDDKKAAFYTDKDTGRWIEKSIKHALTLRCNVIIEGTMRVPEKVAETLQSLRDVGYKTEARALAVNEKLSWQGILERYENQRAVRGSGRMTTPEAHHAGYVGMLKTLEHIEQEKLVDRVILYKRGGILIYENELRNGQWLQASSARTTVESERNRAWTLQEKIAYAKGFDKLMELIKRPERQATIEEVKAIKELQQVAHQNLTLAKNNNIVPLASSFEEVNLLDTNQAKTRIYDNLLLEYIEKNIELAELNDLKNKNFLTNPPLAETYKHKSSALDQELKSFANRALQLPEVRRDLFLCQSSSGHKEITLDNFKVFNIKLRHGQLEKREAITLFHHMQNRSLGLKQANYQKIKKIEREF
jgi:hypothetical protein